MGEVTATLNNSGGTGSGNEPHLKRSLSDWQLIRFGLLCMFPWATTQVWAAAHVASMGMSALVYLIGAVAMLFTALSFRKMANEFPVAGSSYTYVQQAMSPVLGFFAGWLITMDYSVVPGLLIKFSTVWLGAIAPGVPPILIILLFTIIVTAIVYFNGRVADWLMNGFLWGQLITIVLFWVFAGVYVFAHGGGVGHFTLTPFYNPETFNFHTIAQASTLGLLGFLGFDSIATQSEEAKNAAKAVGRSVVLSLILIASIFMVTAFMASLSHPDFTQLDPDMGMFDVIRLVGGDTYYYIVLLACVVFVGIANVIPVMTALTRLLYAMARDRALPFSDFFGKIHPKYQTPSNGALFVGALTLVIALVFELEFLTRLVNFGAMATYFMLNASVIVYFFIRKKQRAGLNFFTNLVFPLIGMSVIGFIFTGFDAKTFLIGGIWIVLGYLLLQTTRKNMKGELPKLEDL